MRHPFESTLEDKKLISMDRMIVPQLSQPDTTRSTQENFLCKRYIQAHG